MRPPGPFPAALRHRPFTRADALAHGVSASRLRSGDVQRVTRGVYRWTGAAPADAAAASVDELAWLQALTVRHSDLVVTGESVARLCGWPLPSELAVRVRPTVLRARGRRPVADPGVRTRLVDLDAVVVGSRRGWPGLRVASPADAWFHLAAETDVDALVVVADRLARRDERRGIVPLASQGELARCVGRHAGDSGVVRAREALRLVREGSDSPAETELRLALVRAGLPEPDLQIELWDADYSIFHPATADLGYRRWRIAVHYEGKTHDGSVQVGKDTRRDAVFLREDWANIRAAGSDRARGFRETVELVRRAIAARSSGR